jgi:hypothetical protein
VDPRLSFVTLGVADLARATAFYEALGLVPSPRGNATVTFFQLSQGLVLALWGADDLAGDAGAEAGSGVRVALAYNVRSREEVEATLARAEAAGGRVSRQPADTPWGVYRGYFLDPDGHAWEIAHNPRATLDPEGRWWLDAPG